MGVLRFCGQTIILGRHVTLVRPDFTGMSPGVTHIVGLRTRPRKVKHSTPLLPIDGDLEHQLRPVVEEVDRLERLASKLAAHLTEEVADCLFGSMDDRAHVKVYSVVTPLVDELVDEHCAAVAGCHLGVKVGDVLLLAWLDEQLTSRRVRVGLQPGYFPGSLSAAVTPSSSNLPSLTSLNDLNCAPSSQSSLEKGGMEPARI